MRRDLSIGVLRSRWSILEVEEGCRGRQSSLEGLRELEAKPGSEHATVGTTKDNAGLVFHFVLCADVLDELDEVHHDLLDGEVDVVLRGERLRWVIGVTDAEVAVLTENKQALSLLSNCLGHEANIVIEAVDVTLVTRVEEDWASLWVPVGVINQIAHLEAGGLSFSIKVVQLGVEEELLRLLVLPWLIVGTRLGCGEAHSLSAGVSDMFLGHTA